MEQSHITPNASVVEKPPVQEVRFEVDLNDKSAVKPNELEQSANDYTMADYTVIGGVKKKKKKKIKRKLIPPASQETAEKAPIVAKLEQDIQPSAEAAGQPTVT